MSVCHEESGVWLGKVSCACCDPVHCATELCLHHAVVIPVAAHSLTAQGSHKERKANGQGCSHAKGGLTHSNSVDGGHLQGGGGTKQYKLVLTHEKAIAPTFQKVCALVGREETHELRRQAHCARHEKHQCS